MALVASTHNQAQPQVQPTEPLAPPVAQPIVQPTEPVVAEPIAQPIAQPTEPVQPTETFDINKYFQEKTGGKITNEEDLTRILTEYNEIGALKAKAAKAEELEVKYKEVEPANDFVSELNKLIKSGADQQQVLEFYNLSQIDLDKLSAKDAAILRIQKETGLSKEDATFKVERLLDENRLDEGEVRENLLDLQVKFKDNINYLKQYRKELTVTEAQKQAEQQQLQRNEFVRSVETVVPDLASQLTSVKFDNISDVKDEVVPFEYVLPDDFRKQMAQGVLKNIIVANGYDIKNPADMQLAKEAALGIAIASDPNRFAKAAIKHYNSVMAERAASKNATQVSPSTKGAVVVQPSTGTTRPQLVSRAAKFN